MWAAISYLLLAIVFIFMGWQLRQSYFQYLFYWTALSLIVSGSGDTFLISQKYSENEKMALFHLYPLGIHSFSTWCTSVQCMES